MSRILIDDKEYEVNPQHNLLQAILSLGLDLPYFCWHPALGSVGSCRQCAVLQYADEKDTRGRLVVACMTPIQDGMRVGLQQPQAQVFRATVIEALMTNHPHDCPVCEEGGECHLQDMTEMSGHTFRHYRGLKRTHRNQYLGPFINHEMNRCIACYRCVRFYHDYAGGDDLSAQAAHNHVYFGRERDGMLESPFSGNLVEVCPTGVFTDRTFSRHYSRKWDLQCAPSVCAHCAVGCNTLPAERYGRILRVTNRYQPEINGYFLCDRGRFGYDFSNAPERLLHSRLRDGDAMQEVDSESVLDALLGRIVDPEQAVFGIGSPRTTLENNFALQRLVGAERFHAGVARREWHCLQILLNRAAHRDAPLATLQQIEQCDAALILGEDVEATAPRVALSLRQLVRNHALDVAASEQKLQPWQDAAVRSYGQWQQTPLWQLVPYRTALADISARDRFAPPGDITRLARALADRLAGREPNGSFDEAERDWVEGAMQMLTAARRPLLLGGCGLGEPGLLEALADIDAALSRGGSEPQLYLAARESNSIGLAALAEQGLDALLSALTDAAAQGLRCSLVILENDLERRLSPAQLAQLHELSPDWLVLDHLATATVDRAQAQLAVPTPFEQQGTLVNASGIQQRVEAVRHPEALPPWRQCVAAVNRRRGAGGSIADGWVGMAGWHDADALRHALEQRHPVFAGIAATGPGADFREHGRKLQRQGPRYGGRTAINAGRQVQEFPPPDDPDSAYCYSMEGVAGPGATRATLWAPGWNSVQALNKFQQEVGGAWRDGAALVRLDFGALASRSPSPVEPVTQTGDWQPLPGYEVFAGEQLSDHAGAIAERAGAPWLGIDPGSARRLEVQNWDSLELHYAGQFRTLHVRIDDSLPPGCLVIPQRAGLWCAAADPAPALELRPATEPLPHPPQLIASDRGGSDA